MSSSLETIGHGVPNSHLSSRSSAGITSGASNHPSRTKWSFNAAKVALKTMQRLSDELQTPRVDITSMSPKFADHTPGTWNTGTSPQKQNAKQIFGNSFNVPIVKLTSPMASKLPEPAIHTPETSTLGLAPKTQPQGPENQFDIIKTIPTHESPDPMNLNEGLTTNQFDFIFFDRMLLEPELHTASMDAVPRFLDSLETTVRKMEDTGLSLQTYMIQQQLVAGIPPDKVEAMFSETPNVNANHHSCRELTVDADELEISITSPGRIDRPRYEGIPPHLSDRVLASILTGSRTAASNMERLRLVRFYYESFRNLSGIAPVVERDGLTVLEGSTVNDDFVTENCDRIEDFHRTEELNDIEDLSSIKDLNGAEESNGIEDLSGAEKDNDIEMGDIDTSDDLGSLLGDDGIGCG